MPPSNGDSQNSLVANVTDVLRNPYRLNQLQTPYSAHYASAYMQSQPALYTTPEGYTLSSTYNPQAAAYSSPSAQRSGPHSFGRGRGQGHRLRTGSTPHHYAQRGASWYKAGDARCTYQGCSFSGSPKSIETHMMDRHLIYPPSWEKDKKQSDWDADPSLRGYACLCSPVRKYETNWPAIIYRKTVPIQGTSLMLDTPEALDAWLAERRKRWPTAERVKEKSVRMKEAIARGQLPPMSSNLRGKKRRYEEGQDSQRRGKRFNNEINRWSGSRTRPTTSGTTPAPSQPSPADIASSVISAPVAQSLSEETFREEEEDDETPEVLSSKKLIRPGCAIADAATSAEEKTAETPNASQTAYKVPRKKEPRLPPRSPFGSRPALLRNVRAVLNHFFTLVNALLSFYCRKSV